jgi:hypothetical protein
MPAWPDFALFVFIPTAMDQKLPSTELSLVFRVAALNGFTM